MASGPIPKTADPGAAALATYLAIFGMKVEPSLLTELLILVGALALELPAAAELVEGPELGLRRGIALGGRLFIECAGLCIFLACGEGTSQLKQQARVSGRCSNSSLAGWLRSGYIELLRC